ncbi:MAG: Cellulase [Firmicutes bacterium]|nr:Cellulase [Bacillota bacterium]
MKQQEFLALMGELTALPGGSGREHAVVAYLAEAMRRCTDRVAVDAIGNVTATFGVGEKKVLVCAHADEVGMLVKYISDQGYIYFEANGMLDERVLLNSKVEIVTASGEIRLGVIGIKSRHLMTPEEMTRPVNISDLWIDVGADSVAGVAALGITVGDQIVFCRHFDLLAGGRFVTKAIDDRAGCAVLIALARELADARLDYTVYLVATTQEEIGSRGIQAVLQRLRPDLALAIDTVPAADPYTPKQQASASMGGGPVIRTADFMPQQLIGAVYSAKIVKRLKAVAEEAGIDYQTDVFRTWTDAARMASAGVPCGGIYIPRRCSHAPVEVADVNDIMQAAALGAALLRNLTAKEIADLVSFL